MGAVEKLLKILQETDSTLLGVIENMKMKESSYVEDALKTIKIPYLGSIRFDESIEDAIGQTKELLSTQFTKDLKNIYKKI